MSDWLMPGRTLLINWAESWINNIINDCMVICPQYQQGAGISTYSKFEFYTYMVLCCKVEDFPEYSVRRKYDRRIQQGHSRQQ